MSIGARIYLANALKATTALKVLQNRNYVLMELTWMKLVAQFVAHALQATTVLELPLLLNISIARRFN